jgi:hypothetical protein
VHFFTFSFVTLRRRQVNKTVNVSYIYIFITFYVYIYIPSIYIYIYIYLFSCIYIYIYIVIFLMYIGRSIYIVYIATCIYTDRFMKHTYIIISFYLEIIVAKTGHITIGRPDRRVPFKAQRRVPTVMNFPPPPVTDCEASLSAV